MIPAADAEPVRSATSASRWLPTTHLEAALLAAIALTALTLRLWYSARLPLESDEAVVGLMGRHILQGERPIFYYGQNYMGALEAYLAAGVFSVLGPSVATMRSVPIAASVLFVVLTYLLAKRLYGSGVALASALYVGASPLFLTIWSVKVRGGYPEILAAGTLLLILLVDVGYRSRQALWRLALLGLLAGVAFWTNQLAIPYLLIVGLFLVAKLRLGAALVAGVALPAFLLGSLPFWVWNVDARFGSLRALLRMSDAPGFTLHGLLVNLRDFLTMSGPVLLGFVEPRETTAMRASLAGGIPPSFYLAWVAEIALALLVVYYLVNVVRKGWRRLLDHEDLPVFALGVLVLVGFCSTYYIPRWLGEPRQFAILYATAPLFAAQIAHLARGARVPIAISVALILAVNVVGTVSHDPNRATVELDSVPVPADVGPLIKYLIDTGGTVIRGDYWIVYRLAFESEERVVGLAIDETYRAHPFTNRYAPYVDRANAAEDHVYVFLANARSDQAFQTHLVGRGVTFRRAEVGGFAVYDELDPQQRVVQ